MLVCSLKTGIVPFIFQNAENIIIEDNNFVNTLYGCEIWFVTLYDLQVLLLTAPERSGHMETEATTEDITQ
jgi:hypothetical protein